jgi:zinc D-Ala-D-Ala dipeptidase
MSLLRAILPLCLLGILASCNRAEPLQLAPPAPPAVIDTPAPQETQPQAAFARQESKNPYALLPDTAFVDLAAYSSGFVYDMKYATEDNFLKTAVYPCAQCLVRKEVADALIRANEHLSRRGLRIKFFDCYRPLDIQKKMWEIYPNPIYVAKPNASGSMHNRGGAVDITLVDSAGQELDMGTGFDHFGREAHHAYPQLSDTLRANRRLMKESMEAAGFRAITSEWWHYSFKASTTYPLSNFSIPCDQEVRPKNP